MTEDLTFVRLGDTWVFADGTVLPVVAGGSDVGVDTAGGETAAAGETAAPDAAESAPAADTAVPAADPAADQGDDSRFGEHAAYIRSLRAEAAEHRVKAKAFEDAFAGYDPADRDVILELAKTLRTDPATAAQWMKEQAEALLLEAPGTAAADQTPPAPGAEGDRPLTRAELDAYLADRERQTQQQQAQQQAMDAVYQQIQDAGFDHESPEETAILAIAANQTDFDVPKAIEAWKARDQKIVADAIEALKNDANGAAHTPPQNGVGRETEKMPDGMGNDFRQMVRDRIAAQQGR